MWLCNVYSNAFIKLDGIIRTWQSDTWATEPNFVLRGHNSTITAMFVKEHVLYSTSLDGTIRIWDLNSELCVKVSNM